jgi:hypothetical protein
MKRVISVSIPRSGHHLLTDLLAAYFRWGEFLHCETYNFEGCCKNIPCTIVDARFKGAFGDEVPPRLFVQKTHDLENEAAIDTGLSYIVQTRDPAQAAIGWLRWTITTQRSRSLGEIGADLFSFFWYYIRFHHKWCMSERLDTQVIYYEDLTASAEQLRDILQETIEWSGLPTDGARLDTALATTVTIDSHTKQKRIFATKTYDLEYYEQICGPSLRYMLNKIPALCPGLKYGGEHSSLPRAAGEEALDDLIVLLPLHEKKAVIIDFTAKSVSLKPESLAVAAGSPTCGPFGLSMPERGVGAWTDGDVVLLPMRVSSAGQCIFGKLVGWPAAELDLGKQLEIYAVVDAKRYPVAFERKHVDRDIEIGFTFDVPPSAGGASRDGALVLKFHGLQRYNAKEPRKLGILLKKLIAMTERLQQAKA